MKIVTYILIILLVAVLGAGAYFYLYMFQPMAAEYPRMQAGMQELDKAKAELKRFKEKESRETAWMKPAAGAFSAGLAEEIRAGKAEVLTADRSIVVNIAEDAIYMPQSYTFTRESETLLAKIDGILKTAELKGRQVVVGNTTDAVPAGGKGRKKTPAKDARTLAAERSAQLVKHLEKKGVDQNALVSAAYASKQAESGSALKARKIIIVITSPLVAVQAPEAAPAAPAAPQAAPKTIPIQPVKPKTN